MIECFKSGRERKRKIVLKIRARNYEKKEKQTGEIDKGEKGEYYMRRLY